MRKILLLILVLSLFLLPSVARAQGEVRFGSLTVQLWPEYDHPEMLVMYSFSMAADSPLPAEVEIRIPANAEMNAVAAMDGAKMVNVPYNAPVKDGDWVVITITVDNLNEHRVEYYAPIEKDGTTRNYNFHWENDYAIDQLFVEFQQPPSANNITSSPALPTVSDAGGGISYHKLEAGEWAAGKAFDLQIKYEKPNDSLTVSSMPVEVGGGTNPEPASAPSSFSLDNALPLILVGVGILLIAGGLFYFFSAGRKDIAPQARKRHAPNTAAAGGNVYCHECGSRANKNDKFCRSCGAKLRK